MRAALVKLSDNSIVRIENNIDINVAVKEGFKWLPCPKVPRPSYDDKTHVLTGPTYVVTANEVIETWTLTAKSSDELDTELQDRADALETKLLLNILYDMESRMRVREGRAAITKVQYHTALKNRLAALD